MSARDGHFRTTARKLGSSPMVGARRAGEGPKGFPRVPGQALIQSPALRGTAAKQACPRSLLSRASDPAGQRCRMPEPWRSRPPKAHRCEAFSDAASKRRRFASPAERAATRPMLSAISAESRPKEKAACVSGGSAERPQFSRTGRARQRGRRRSEERRVGKECRSRWSPYH